MTDELSICKYDRKIVRNSERWQHGKENNASSEMLTKDTYGQICNQKYKRKSDRPPCGNKAK